MSSLKCLTSRTITIRLNPASTLQKINRVSTEKIVPMLTEMKTSDNNIKN